MADVPQHERTPLVFPFIRINGLWRYLDATKRGYYGWRRQALMLNHQRGLPPLVSRTLLRHGGALGYASRPH
eukprot:2160172-Amphidinium_carterae.1